MSGIVALDRLAGVRPRVVLLDVNGTLTDPSEIGAPWNTPELGHWALDAAITTAMVDALWDAGRRPFAEHLRAAVEVQVAEAGLDPAGIEPAVAAAGALPARPGAAAALALLAGEGLRLVALTNSGAEAGARTLEACGLAAHVERVLGVDAVATFKPHPAVYAYALGELGVGAAETMLIATHPWDLTGAKRSGLATAWVTHGVRGWPGVFPAPDVRGRSLRAVAEALVRLPREP
jgi:2-haloacid dehalogenase